MKCISRFSTVGRKYAQFFTEAIECQRLIPTLGDVYKTYSRAKDRAYSDCVDKVYEAVDEFNKRYYVSAGLYMRPWDWGVISYNTSSFTFGAILKVSDDDGETVKWYFLVITKDNTYFIQ